MNKAILIGAGEAGNLVLNNQHEFGFEVDVWLDDDKAKHAKMRKRVESIDVINSLPKYLSHHDVIIVAIVNAQRSLLERIKRMSPDSRSLIMPPVYQQLERFFKAEPLRPYSIEDFLCRPSRKINLDISRKNLGKSTVLIAGAGGSIGSELTKLIGAFGCLKLILVDIDENSLEEIRMRLEEDRRITFEAHLCDLKNPRHLEKIFDSLPDVVFNCAAHKHVSAGQRNPSETVYNNLMVTRNLLNCCAKAGTEKLVHISTDKAIRPTSVMGASKTLCESMILSWKGDPKRYIVRFGNVLNSQGSVLRVWERQLEEGSVLTVTNPNMRRYVMSISEACQLIIKSLEFDPGTYILDMGPRTTVSDLLDAFLMMNNKTRTEVQTRYEGMKNGEKHTEEIFWPQETHKRTKCSKIYRVERSPVFDHKRPMRISRQYDDRATMHELRKQFRRLM